MGLVLAGQVRCSLHTLDSGLLHKRISIQAARNNDTRTHMSFALHDNCNVALGQHACSTFQLKKLCQQKRGVMRRGGRTGRTEGASGMPSHDHHLSHQGIGLCVGRLRLDADVGLQQVRIRHLYLGSFQREGDRPLGLAPLPPQLCSLHPPFGLSVAAVRQCCSAWLQKLSSAHFGLACAGHIMLLRLHRLRPTKQHAALKLGDLLQLK